VDDLAENPWAGAFAGIAVGVTLAIAGYLLAVADHASYGSVIFCLLPFLTGFSIAAVVRPKKILAASLITVAILSGSILILTGLEGYICVVMAAPLMISGMAIGALAGYWLIGQKRERRRFDSKRTLLLLGLMPALMAAAEYIERPHRQTERRETFATTIHVNASPEQTWNGLTHIPEMSGPKPFLLAIGLPIPTHCRLDEQANGADRVCVFDQGEIAQRVTAWQPHSGLRIAVTNSTLPGRRWLQFIDAGYELTPTPSGTTLTRYSTIGSRLYPRWYWRTFEEWGVTSEHEYVLANVKRIAESN
jgi:hypothetical protein